MTISNVFKAMMIAVATVIISSVVIFIITKSPSAVVADIALIPVLYCVFSIKGYSQSVNRLFGEPDRGKPSDEYAIIQHAAAEIEAYKGDKESMAAVAARQEESLRGNSKVLKSIIHMFTVISGKIRSIRQEMNGLSNSIVESSSASIQITRTIENFLHMIENQTAAITETSASVEESNASMQNIRRNTNQSLEKSEVLYSLTKTSEELMNETNTTITEIVKKVSTIEEVIVILNNISSQTNLLAMNAAIEAAHAGDAGKGFAVVADEIRKLAESSASNSKLIGQSLKSIIADVSKVQESGKNGSENFALVTDEVSNMIKSLSEIDAATEEILQGSDEILKAIIELTSVSANIESGSKEIALSIDEITNATTEIQEMSQRSTDHLQNVESATTETLSSLQSFSELNIIFSETNHTLKTMLVDESGAVKTADVQTMILKHLLWLTKVRLVMDGRLQVDINEIGDHTTCDLGRAFDSTLGQAWRNLPFYGELTEKHKTIHGLIRKILENKGVMDQEKLEAFYEELVEVSGSIIGFLNQL